MTATQMLQACGLRPTLGRLLVLEVLREHASETPSRPGRGLSPDHVYARIRDRGEAVALPSIYKALTELRVAELAERYRFGSSAAVFAFRGGQRTMVHQICTRCACVRELGDAETANRLLAMASDGDFLAKELVIQGLCAECGATDAPTPPRRPAPLKQSHS